MNTSEIMLGGLVHIFIQQVAINTLSLSLFLSPFVEQPLVSHFCLVILYFFDIYMMG